MKHLLRIFSMLFVLTSISAFGDSVSYVTATFSLNPNDGSGDNIGGNISGPGINVGWGGGTPFDWFNSSFPFSAPGSGGGGGTTIDPDYVAGTIGSQSYSGGQELSLYPVTLTAGGFTFPTNGQQNFTVTVPASMGLLTLVSNEPCTSSIDCPQTWVFATRQGELTLSYTYETSPFGNGYVADSGFFTSTATPEPGTLGLIAIGMCALLWRWRTSDSQKFSGCSCKREPSTV